MVRGHDRDQEATSFALDRQLHQLAVATSEARGVVRLGSLRGVATPQVVVGESAEPYSLDHKRHALAAAHRVAPLPLHIRRELAFPREVEALEPVDRPWFQPIEPTALIRSRART